MFLLCNFIYFIIVSPMLLMFYCSCHYTLPTSCTLGPTKQCGCSNSDDSVPVGNRKPKYSICVLPRAGRPSSADGQTAASASATWSLRLFGLSLSKNLSPIQSGTSLSPSLLTEACLSSSSVERTGSVGERRGGTRGNERAERRRSESEN